MVKIIVNPASFQPQLMQAFERGLHITVYSDIITL